MCETECPTILQASAHGDEFSDALARSRSLRPLPVGVLEVKNVYMRISHEHQPVYKIPLEVTLHQLSK